MFDDFGGFNTFDDFNNDFMYQQQDMMQQELFQAATERLSTKTVRGNASATGRISTAGNNGTKPISIQKNS